MENLLAIPINPGSWKKSNAEIFACAIKTKSSVACLHPYQNNFITHHTTKSYITTWYVDEQNNLHKMSRIYVPNSILSIIGYDLSDEENNNLIAMRKDHDDKSETLVVLDISHYKKNNEKNSKEPLTYIVP